MASRKPNRLINEKSPYLLQHAYNPVDWYPWGEEAFKVAKTRNVPIFLSIGYSTCHWCHVMMEESFEDEEIARILNENFVAIKVDREEHPEVDEFYMNICQITFRQCGWPLNLFLTPSGKPFMVFTYLPKESRGRYIGFRDLLLRVIDMWKNNRGEISVVTANIMNLYKELVSPHPSKINAKQLVNAAFGGLVSMFDEVYGGFGNAPKFPQPQRLVYLVWYYKIAGVKKALDMVEKTLKTMRLSGIYDQVGYGFHRYSTDREWRLPHFEKMLYDQALLLNAYIEAFSATGNRFYGIVIDEIYQYVLDVMTDKNGGFYTGEDARSMGIEGYYYTWTYEELKEALGGDFETAKEIFDIRPEGNYIEESIRMYNGRNVLHSTKSIETIAKELDKNEAEALEIIKKLTVKLRRFQAKKKRPAKDEKILTDWNSLMIISLAKAYRVTGENKYLEMGEKALKFLLEKNFKNNKLYHVHFKGTTIKEGLLEDYVFMVDALIEIYNSTFKIEYLEKAKWLMEETIQKFWDEEKGFILVEKDKKLLPGDVRRTFEGSTPPGNTYASLVLFKLYHMLGIPKFKEIGERSLEKIGEDIVAYPYHHPTAMLALLLLSDKTKEIVIVSESEEEKNVREAIKEIWKKNRPNIFTIVKTTENREKLAALAKYTKYMEIRNNKTTFYICRNNTCDLPTNNIEAIKNL